MSDDAIAPSTSTMALSFAEVTERLPAGVTLERGLDGLVLSARIGGVRPAAGVVAGGVVFGGYVGLMSPDLVPWGPLAILAIAGWIATSLAIGRRRIVIDGDGLRVQTRPFGLPGDGRVSAEIRRLEVVVVGKRSGSTPSYRIDAVTRDEVVPLVQDIFELEQARVLSTFLAHELRLAPPTLPST